MRLFKGDVCWGHEPIITLILQARICSQDLCLPRQDSIKNPMACSLPTRKKFMSVGGGVGGERKPTMTKNLPRQTFHLLTFYITTSQNFYQGETPFFTDLLGHVKNYTFRISTGEKLHSSKKCMYKTVPSTFIQRQSLTLPKRPPLLPHMYSCTCS